MPSRLDALRARLENATPGPWEYTPYEDGVISHRVSPRTMEPIIALGDDGGCSDPECCGVASYHVEINEADAALIAHAPADLTALLAVVEAAQDCVTPCSVDRGFCYAHHEKAARCSVAALDTALAALTTEEE